MPIHLVIGVEPRRHSGARRMPEEVLYRHLPFLQNVPDYLAAGSVLRTQPALAEVQDPRDGSVMAMRLSSTTADTDANHWFVIEAILKIASWAWRARGLRDIRKTVIRELPVACDCDYRPRQRHARCLRAVLGDPLKTFDDRPTDSGRARGQGSSAAHESAEKEQNQETTKYDLLYFLPGKNGRKSLALPD